MPNHELDLALYCIRHNFTYRKCHDFGLGAEIHEGVISRFSDVFITINRHQLKWKFLQGLTREILENKTTAKITMYSVVVAIVYNFSIFTSFET